MIGDVERCQSPDNPRRHSSEMSTLMCNKGMKMFHRNVKGLFGNHFHLSALLQNFSGIDILSMSATHIVVGNKHEGVYHIPDCPFISCLSSNPESDRITP